MRSSSLVGNSVTAMKAAIFVEAGDPRDRLEVRDVEIPTPRHDEVLVRVDARPIQPADFMFIEGRYRIKPALPQIAGLEGSGIVVATVPSTQIQAGTRVAFRHPGTWAEFVTVPKDRLYVVPEGIDAGRAAQFSLNPVTAWGAARRASDSVGRLDCDQRATSNIAQLVHALCRRRNISMLGIVGPDREPPASFVSLSSNTPGLPERVLAADDPGPRNRYYSEASP